MIRGTSLLGAFTSRGRVGSYVTGFTEVPGLDPAASRATAGSSRVSDLNTGYVSDYDLLVAVDDLKASEDAPVWSDIRKRVDRFAQPATAPLLVYEVRELNHEIRRGQLFFSEIVEQAIVLYDSKRFALAY